MAKAQVGGWGEGSGEGTEVKTNPKDRMLPGSFPCAEGCLGEG